jgi:CDP-glucose 4,6-dehydratase
MENMEMTRLFNTAYHGNTGFKGGWLTVWMLNMGAEVYGISKDVPTNPSLFELLDLKSRITHYVADIRDLKRMEQIMEEVQPDFVFHLAAQPIVIESYHNPVDTMSTNVMGTLNILEALRKLSKPCAAIMITSDKCYDNVEWHWGYRESDALGGKDPYSASKGAAELMIKTYFHSFFAKENSQVKIVSVRAGNVIGGGDWAGNRIVPDCYRAWIENKKVEIRQPNATRPWQHVLEPLSGYLAVGQKLAEDGAAINGEPFNFGPNSDQNKTVLELITALASYEKKKDLIDVTGKAVFKEAGLLKLNCDKALHFLDWRPVLLFNETAKFTALWYGAYKSSPATLYETTTDQLEEYITLAQTRNLSWSSI